jgi:hypothetical protein
VGTTDFRDAGIGRNDAEKEIAMVERHIPEELLKRFFRNQATAQESRRAVRHLLKSCLECSEMTRRVGAEIGPWATGTRLDASYDQAFERAFVRMNEEERRHAA